MKLGRTAKYIRKQAGLTLKVTAARLGVSTAHVCNVELNHRVLSPSLRDRYEEVFGVDLYITAWLLFGDVKKLPPSLRDPTRRLAIRWKRAWDLRLGNSEPGEVT